MVDFKVVVRSKEDPVVAREMLAKYINPEHPNCLDEADMGFISKQDYITAVPVEIALTVTERENLQRMNSNLKVIVTGVTEANAKNLVETYGYTVLEPEPPVPVGVEEEKESRNDILSPSDTVTIGDKTYSAEELEKIVSNHEKAKKQLADMKKGFEANPFFREFFKDGLFSYNIL